MPCAPYPSFPVGRDDGPLDRIDWAAEAPIRSPAAKAVLLQLARHANSEGVAWPSFNTMARRTSLSRSTVIRAVKELEGTGWLACERHDRKPTRYRPKAPQQCGGCGIPLPSGVTMCPACGLVPSVTVTPPSVMVTPAWCHGDTLRGNEGAMKGKST